MNAHQKYELGASDFHEGEPGEAREHGQNKGAVRDHQVGEPKCTAGGHPGVSEAQVVDRAKKGQKQWREHKRNHHGGNGTERVNFLRLEESKERFGFLHLHFAILDPLTRAVKRHGNVVDLGLDALQHGRVPLQQDLERKNEHLDNG